MRQFRYIDLVYFLGLASMTIYIGAHRGLGVKLREQIGLKEVRGSISHAPTGIAESALGN